MRTHLIQELLSNMKKIPVSDVRKFYFSSITNSVIDEGTLLRFEFLDMFKIRKRISRAVRNIVEVGNEENSILYIQINPSKQWQISIGSIPDAPNEEMLSQKVLFSMQEKTTVCGSCPEAGALYLQSNNMPWEQAALQFLLACTLIEIFLVFQDLSEELCLYFGLAHSHYCVKVGQIEEYMVD